MAERDPYRVRVSFNNKWREKAIEYLDEKMVGELCCEEEGMANIATVRTYAYDSGGSASADMRKASGTPGLISLLLDPRSKCSKAGCPNKLNE